MAAFGDAGPGNCGPSLAGGGVVEVLDGAAEADLGEQAFAIAGGQGDAGDADGAEVLEEVACDHRPLDGQFVGEVEGGLPVLLFAGLVTVAPVAAVADLNQHVL